MSEWIRDTMPLVGQQVEALNHDGDVVKAVFRGDGWSLDTDRFGWFQAPVTAVKAWRPKFVGEAVDHPPHYGQVPGIECIQVVRWFDFNRGNAIKYIWRAGHKGHEIEDLEKAIWYLQDEIKRLKGEA